MKPDERHYYGLLKLSDSISLGCGTYVVKEEDGSDWVLFYVPGNMVSRSLGGEAENEDLFKPELKPLLTFFQDLAARIYRHNAFELGLIGHEVSGELYAETLTKQDLETSFAGILLPKTHEKADHSTGQSLSEDLYWFAPEL